jgi:hypothetical protein
LEGRRQAEDNVALSLDVLGILINEQMQPQIAKRPQPGATIKAEKLRFHEWIYGPALAALDAAAKQSRKFKQTDTI